MSEPYPADPYLLTLHALTLRQLANAEQLAVIIDLDADDLTTALEKAVADGAAMAARGAYMITPTGRQTLDEVYPTWFATIRSDADVAAAIEKFETGVNKQVLTLTTDWQTVEVDGVRNANDHSDPDHDAKVIDKLGRVQERTASVLLPFVDVDPTVSRFLVRLAAALTRVDNGEIEYVSGVRVDSFHTVWFQMHEHLLRSTGRTRPE